MDIFRLSIPIITGLLLAMGQLFMKRLAAIIELDKIDFNLIITTLTNHNTICFISLDLLAITLYLFTLKNNPLVISFALVSVSMNVWLCIIDKYINQTNFPFTTYLGVFLGLISVLFLMRQNIT